MPIHTQALSATVQINDKPVVIEWTQQAQQALERRDRPLVLGLELYFSCLVKKFVHFHDDEPARPTIPVNDRLHVYFRVVTSTACTMDVAERLGRQPEIDIAEASARRFAPKRVWLDLAAGRWSAEYWV